MSNVNRTTVVDTNMGPNSTVVDIIKKKMRLGKEELEKYKDESRDLKKQLELEQLRRQEVEVEVTRLTKRIQILQSELDNYQERLVIATYKIANSSQAAIKSSLVRKELMDRNKNKHDRVAALEAQLTQSSLQEKEANQKYNEVCKKLVLMELDLDHAEAKASKSERKVLELEEELRALGKSYKALEACEERGAKERDNAEEKYRVMIKLLDETEARSAFSDLTVLKLRKEVERLNEHLTQERENYEAARKIVNDSLDIIGS